MYLGDPADDGLRIFSLTGRAVDAMANEQAFEKFIESVKDRLESTYIWASSEMRQSAAKQAIPLLETAANTDPITTKCFLCRL